MSWNEELFMLVYGAIGAGTLFEELTVFLAWWFPYLLICGAFVYELYRRDEGRVFPAVFRLFFPPAVAYSIAAMMKLTIEFPRPFVTLAGVNPLVTTTDFLGSFPSAHATFFMALGVTMCVSNRSVGIFYIVSALLIGIARIGAGVHWPLDVAAGFFLGIVLASLAVLIYHLVFRTRSVTREGHSSCNPVHIFDN